MRLSTLIALAALVALFVWAQKVNQRPDPLAGRMAGRAEAIDGDSLVVNGQRIRLQGIDAPEFNQTCRRDGAEYRCGREAHQALRRLIRQGEVTCSGFEHDRFDRLLGVCQVNGENIAARMVRDGLAVSYGDFLVEEARARQERKGLWAGEFDMPRDWRAAHPRIDPPLAPPAASSGAVRSDAPIPPPRPRP